MRPRKIVPLLLPWFSYRRFGGEIVQRIKSISFDVQNDVCIKSFNSTKLKTCQAGRPREKAEPGSESVLPAPHPHRLRDARLAPISDLRRAVISGPHSLLEGQRSSLADVFSDFVLVLRVPI